MASNEQPDAAVSNEKGHLPPPAEDATPRVEALTSNELRDATDEEIQILRHVIDRLPRKVWIALLASGAERLTYYVISTPWRKCLVVGRWTRFG